MRLGTESPELKNLRARLAELMRSGVETEWQQRAYTDAAVRERLGQLQRVEPSDYEMKLKIAGFTLRPYRPPEHGDLEQSCATCMYYARHRKYCELPELAMPVLPRWSCVLWRI